MWFEIYLAGVVIILVALFYVDRDSDEITWGDLIAVLSISALSWFLLLIVLVAALAEFGDNYTVWKRKK